MCGRLRLPTRTGPIVSVGDTCSSGKAVFVPPPLKGDGYCLYRLVFVQESGGGCREFPQPNAKFERRIVLVVSGGARRCLARRLPLIAEAVPLA